MPNVPNVPNVPKCPECGSASVVRDQLGEYVCNRCGLVVAELGPAVKPSRKPALEELPPRKRYPAAGELKEVERVKAVEGVEAAPSEPPAHPITDLDYLSAKHLGRLPPATASKLQPYARLVEEAVRSHARLVDLYLSDRTYAVRTFVCVALQLHREATDLYEAAKADQRLTSVASLLRVSRGAALQAVKLYVERRFQNRWRYADRYLKLIRCIGCARLQGPVSLDQLLSKHPRLAVRRRGPPCLRLKLGSANVQLFRTGKAVINASTLEQCREAVVELSRIAERPIVKGFEPKNFVVECGLGHPVNLEEAARRLKHSVRDPGRFPGLRYKPPEAPSALIFGTGKLVIIGAKSIEEAKSFYEGIKAVLKG